ncbi:MAG: hypothetical protein DHS20C05_15480 [Hyphococcus sp.]|nr:MAG: hypothetical protein DHS20C05_15480 [Marinicaulis sp.]
MLNQTYQSAVFSLSAFLAIALWLFLPALAYAAAQDTTQTEQPEVPPFDVYKMDFSFEGLDDLSVFVLSPKELNAATGHKILVYFVGGGQEAEFAQSSLGSEVAREALRRGYIFVSPAAPCYDCTFVAKGDQYFPKLFEILRETFPMAEDRFHLMGFSNGGRSSFHLATRHPEWVASITAYPGYLRGNQFELLENLNETCVVMYVGKQDRGFAERHRDLVRRLKKLKRPVHEKIYIGEGHNIDPLWTQEGAKQLMDGIDQGWGCPE